VGPHLAGEVPVLGLFQHIPKAFGLLHLRFHGVDDGIFGLGDGFGQLSIAIFLQRAKDRRDKEAQGILFFLPYREAFEESCEPEQVYI
jgi:hypothetical protein